MIIIDLTSQIEILFIAAPYKGPGHVQSLLLSQALLPMLFCQC